MQLGCTQKAMNYFKKPSKTANTELDPLFTWSAGITTFNRRNTVLVLNDATLSGFLIWGLTVQDCKNLNDIIIRGIRHMFATECISPEVTDLYLKTCGETVIYTKPISHFMQEKLRTTLEELKNLRSSLVEQSLYQPLFVRRLNSTYTSHQTRKHYQPRVELHRQLREYYHLDQICKVRMALLSVHLKDINATRVLRVPMDLPVYQLHHAIQKSFRWLDTHPHLFLSEREETLDLFCPTHTKKNEGTSYQASYTQLEKQITVRELFLEQSKIFYVYDYRNFWIHEIEFLKTEEITDEKIVYCLEATGEAPPENIMSVTDFHRFLEIYNDPFHKEHEKVINWAAEQNWLPLQLKTINHNLSTVMDGWYL